MSAWLLNRSTVSFIRYLTFSVLNDGWKWFCSKRLPSRVMLIWANSKHAVFYTNLTFFLSSGRSTDLSRMVVRL